MRFPKPFGILCATALCASILPVRADDNPAQAAARAAVLQMMQQQDAAGINAAPADATSSAPVVAAPVTTVPVVTTNPTPAPAPVAAPAAPTVAAPSTPVYRPIIAPSLPISADQQARLQALDAKYSANQITPLDYFTQREAIMKGQ